MASIRSRGNGSTELRFASLLRGANISGWRRHLPLPGHPDFVFRTARVAVFIDGCFWHSCPRCSSPPRQNTSYWGPKLERNRERDRTVNRALRAAGWKVVRIWEHELNQPNRVLGRLQTALSASAH
jgi:DNA mismatch endonuclease (patch repair protein)